PGALIHPHQKKGEEKWQEVMVKEELKEEEVKKAIVFTAEEVETILGNIETLMRVSTPFLKHRYCIRDMAEQLGMPSYQLSAFINQNAGMNFNDFINKERIAYCIKLIDEDQIDGLNLFGLSDKCGFSNRNTFRNAFKKFTGKTPSIFIKDN
ncbi:MAG: AraC family transcriptional regulator, partial [Chitinophagaceae bacterium]|nr:AraC family transcriptional regulator [Chitinophagaceae bacterium]